MFSVLSARFRCRHLVGAVSVVLATLLSLPLLAQAPPSADAFVSSAYPTTNFGVVNSLAVGPGSTSYIQFNLSGIPAGATVSKASLRLYVDLVTKAGKFDVYQVTKNWSENTLTYNSQPLPLGASLTGGAGVSITAASCNQFLLIDVTPQVQSWLTSPDTNKGLALSLVSGSSGNFFFDAKESLLTANGPELELALSSVGPQGPPGPQGATGAQGPAGLQGPPGIDGAQGSQGPAGPKGPAGLTWRGPFDCNGTYAVGDVVSYQGESWVDANLPIGGCVQPPFDPWQLLAQKGTDGPQGLQGQQGPIGLQGPQGATGLQGAQGAAGSQGPTGPVGPDGPQGPPGPGGFNGMKEFSSATLVDPYIWLAPPNVTHVLVEMWGGGGGGGSLYGGGGGAYSRSVVAVTPGATYEIRVGAGGAAAQPGQSYGRSGGDSSMSVLGGSDLIHATGGAYTGSGGFIDFRADIARSGLSLNGFGGGAAFGAQFCPGPYLETTGHGGDPLQGGIAGYVLLTW